MHIHTKGRLAEAAALAYFLARGWWPAARPRSTHVQTDLLLRRGKLVLVVEVKFRRSNLGAANAVTPSQLARLARETNRLAALYPDCAVRADILHVSPSWPFFRHVPGAIPLAA